MMNPCNACTFRFENKASPSQLQSCCTQTCSQYPSTKRQECQNKCTQCFGEAPTATAPPPIKTQFAECYRIHDNVDGAFKCCLRSCRIDDYNCHESCIDVYNSMIETFVPPPSTFPYHYIILVLILILSQM